MCVDAFIKKEQMKILQNYESLCNIISMALGGSKSKKKGEEIQSRDQLLRALSKMKGETR